MKLKRSHLKMTAVAIVMFCRSVFQCQLLQAIVGLGVIVLLSGLPSQARTNAADLDRKVRNLRQARLLDAAASEFVEPPVRSSVGGLLDTQIRVFYANNMIGDVPVRLRSYEGLLTGPTLRFRPGDLLRVLMINDLPPNVGPEHPEDINLPHGANTTNLHTHGLHVDPKDPGDNVLRQIPPGEQWQYEYDIEADHPAGTFWYHAHKHGSTALHLGNGMAGALIIEGGIDEIPEIQAAKERLFVLQQIPYNESGTVEQADVTFSFGIDFGASLPFPIKEVQTTINGQLKPAIEMNPGEVQRWRIINAGIHEMVEIVIVDLSNPDEPITHDLHVIALDGLTLGRIDTKRLVELGPGYRVDVLVQFDEPGTYQLAKVEQAPDEGLLPSSGRFEKSQILAEVVVEGEAVSMSLPSDASLQPYVAHQPISDAEVTGTQLMEYYFNVNDPANIILAVNRQPSDPDAWKRFDPNNVRKLRLGGVDEWILTANEDTHPFHIHVNPFQVMSIGGVPVDPPEFRDTIFVREKEPVVIRTRYEKYTGKFVQHCHILIHEDGGMMEVLEIVDPAREKPGDDVFFARLSRGLNMISLPLKPITPYTARSFAEMISASVIIKFDDRRQKFVGFTLGAPGPGFAIEGGKGYIVSVPEEVPVAFVGSAWTNDPSVHQAPPAPTELTNSSWAFIVTGKTTNEIAEGYVVTVRNTRTNNVVTDVVREGYFAVAFADLSRQSVVEVGDRLKVSVMDMTGEIASEPMQLTVTQEAISQAFVLMTLKNIGKPRQSVLQQNYPNPFNPETWLPYQLKEAAPVTIQIYDAQGGLVRTLDLGQHAAGFYTSRARAAYWDGKNDTGESVASGVYFYQLRAGDFSATRRLAVVK